MPLLQRLCKYLSKPAVDPATAALYRACVAAARRPEFYQAFAVPDSIDGRFDLLLLHVFLVMHRLRGESEARQRLFDLMFADMDRSLREMGVGDMSIGKKIRPMISAFYGRGQAYEKAIGAGDAALAAALGRNLYGAAQIAPDILQKMTAYVRRAIDSLERQPVANLLSGQVEFPAPLAI